MDARDYLEQVDTLWNIRDAGVSGPNLRLVDLARLDERIEAFIKAAAIFTGGEVLPDTGPRRPPEAAALFMRLAVALAANASRSPGRVFEWLTAMSDDPSAANATRGFCSALSWAPIGIATAIMQALLQQNGPGARAIAIASLGARRSEPGPALAAALADPSPLVRARAYRTTGQLGRADLMAHLRPGLTDDDSECRFWSAWAASRMGGGEEALGVVAEIAWTNQPRTVRALDVLLRCLELPHANAWLREFAKLPDRQRDLIRATGVVGDPVYVPWLIERMVEPETARLAGEAFSMITGLDLAYRDLDRKQPADFESGPNDDPADENVALDEDDNLPWPDPERIGSWWLGNIGHYQPGTGYFLGTPKSGVDWLGALSDAFQRQRRAAALELAIRMPKAAMFEVRARGRLQRRLIARSRGLA